MFKQEVKAKGKKVLTPLPQSDHQLQHRRDDERVSFCLVLWHRAHPSVYTQYRCDSTYMFPNRFETHQ